MKAPGPLALILALGLWATAAYGDGGALLLHQDAGPFTLTLFAAPQPLATGMADLSILVQDRNTGGTLLDPVVDATAEAADGSATQTVRLARGNSGNRLLQAGRLQFARPGRWRLNVRVRRGQDVVLVSTECTVQPDTSRATIVWFYVLLPAAMILLFLLHQFLKQRQSPRQRG